MEQKDLPFERDERALLARCAQALTRLQLPQQAAAAEYAAAAAAAPKPASLPQSGGTEPRRETQTVWAELQRTPGGGITMTEPAAASAPGTIPTVEALSRAFERDARRYG